MKVNIRYDRNNDDWEDVDVELDGYELSSFLSCNAIGYGGSYYRITSKIFEFVNEDRELSVIAKLDLSVTD